jgi:hypothetical protein
METEKKSGTASFADYPCCEVENLGGRNLHRISAMTK